MEGTYVAMVALGGLAALAAHSGALPGSTSFLHRLVQTGWTATSASAVIVVLVVLDAIACVAVRRRCTRTTLLAAAT